MDEDIRQHLDRQCFRDAFELLVDRYQHKVFRLAFSLVRDQSLAEDMAQDIFIRVWKGLPGYQGQASLSTWLYTISRNTCLTELKRRATRPLVSLEHPEMEGALERLPAPAPADAEAGSRLDVQVMLAQLPEKYRQVLTLFYLEQKSYEEVAALLGLPLGTVKTFLHRARKELLKLSGRSETVYA